MHITLLTYGSRGDVQPFLALGIGLQRAGHTVRLAAPERFAAFITAHGLEYARLTGDPAEMTRELAETGGNSLLRVSRTIQDFAVPLGVQVFQDLEDACQGTDAIVYSFLIAIPCHHIAGKLGIPEFFVHLQPLMTPTREFPSLLFPRSPVLTGFINRLTHHIFNAFFWQSNRLSYHWVRRKHPELPQRLHWPLAHDNPRRPTTLYAFSPSVIPRPADWPRDVHVTGYWFLETPGNWTPPQDLLDFLADGPPPVYVGFGSMASEQVADAVQQSVQALQGIGQRGIIASGWSDLGGLDLPDTIYRLDAAPHAWLFPQTCAIVHHAGAGTTAAALSAGVPSVGTPFFGDQFYWAARAAELGTAPTPLRGDQLGVESLGLAIHTAATYPPMIQRAAELGQQIQAEDGITRAIQIIELEVETAQRMPE